MFGGHDDNAQAAQTTAAPVAAPTGGTLPAPTDDGGVGTAPAGAPPLASYDPEAIDNGREPAAVTGVVAPTAAATVAPAAAVVPAADGDDLLNIKQQALQQLTPLVGHLDQTPEEKFRTTMMMIQAADNQALIKDAYEAAQAITDEKARAQALLDIVNEINYFTQQQEPQQ